MTPRHPATRGLWRVTGVLSAAWGCYLLSRGDTAWRSLTGHAPEPAEEFAIRVLGARHFLQGGFEAVAPGRLPKTLIAVDILHAASMVALAAESPSHRRPALLSAAVAGSSATALTVLLQIRGRR